MYDFLIVGAGLFGSVFAQQCKEKGKTCLVIDKRNHIGGNCYSEKIEGIDVHKYGPHIFHCNNEEIWQYVQKFSKFIQYTHKVKVKYNGNLYSMPINLQTMYEIYGTETPEKACRKLKEVRIPIENPKNLEEHCLSQIGPELYNVFIRFYTQKQWMRDPKELPTSIIKRLPVRMNFDDRWHQSIYSGIPSDGYTQWVSNMLDGVNIELGVDFFELDWKKYAKRLVFSGKIDELFDYCYGELEYRTLRFENKTLDGDYQGIAQINYTDEKTPFTRTTEHKHFTYKQCDKTVVTWEYPEVWSKEATPYYPINDTKNDELLVKYKKLAEANKEIVIGGRLGKFAYQDMHQIIGSALKLSTEHLL